MLDGLLRLKTMDPNGETTRHLLLHDGEMLIDFLRSTATRSTLIIDRDRGHFPLHARSSTRLFVSIFCTRVCPYNNNNNKVRHHISAV